MNSINQPLAAVPLAAAPLPLIPLWNQFSYFEHQEHGIRWMLNKEKRGTEVSSRDLKSTVTVRGGFQCDDMGLGKTIQITSTMVNHVKKQTLLIAPLAMIETWADVCQRAGMAVYEVVKGAWAKRSGNNAIPRHFMKCRPAVYISNYEKLNSTELFNRSWDRIVLDEAHKIRNGDSKIAKRACKIQAPIRWVVTGTPLVNSLRDIVSLLAFIGVPCSPFFFWEKTRFSAMMPELLIHRSLDSLRGVINGAPPVPIIQEESLPFTTEEEDDFYRGVQGETEIMMARYSRELLSPAEMFKRLLRLRQISVHPQIYINALRREIPTYDRDNWVTPSTKFTKIKKIMKEDTADKTHKYIIFCQFHEEMSLLREFLLAESLAKDDNILLYHGGMNQAERKAVLQSSKKSTETTVMLLQLHAGGVGLNLQEYDRIIFVSPWWTSALMDQAIARAVRMGQTEVVNVYHLRLETEEVSNTINIDRIINAKVIQKRKMLEQLFQLCNHE
jgi:SNF2 family DNA or RNA helicase